MRLRRQLATLILATTLVVVPMQVAVAGDYVTVDTENDIALYFEQAGDGERVVLFVPGWTMTTRFFKHQLAHYDGSTSIRFITYDPRAHGRSSKTIEGANYATHAADLKAFIDGLKLKNVVLGGWSWGGITVYEYLKAYGSDNLAGVVLMDQTPRPLPLAKDSWTDGGPDAVLGFFRAFDSDRLAAVKEFIPWMYTNGISDADAAWMLADSMLTPKIVASLLLYDGWMVDHRETIVQTKVPQLHVVRVDQQPFAEPYLKANLPKATTLFLGGHGQFYDHADTFNATLDTFINGLAAQ